MAQSQLSPSEPVRETMDGEQALAYFLDKVAAKAPKPFVPVSTEDRAIQRSKEMEMWKTWKDGGQKPEHLDPLLKSFSNLISQRMTKFRGAEVPKAAVEMEHKKELLKALRTFDPTKGTTLTTYVIGQLPKAGRYVANNQNFARISLNIGEKIGQFNALKSNLTETLGHEPDAQAIHDHLLQNPHETLGRLSLKQINRFNKDQRKGLLESSSNANELAGRVYSLSGEDAREEEVIKLIYPQLAGDERAVYEYIYGVNGKPALKRGEIAKKMGWDAPKVSKVVASIRSKVLAHL